MRILGHSTVLSVCSLPFLVKRMRSYLLHGRRNVETPFMACSTFLYSKSNNRIIHRRVA